DNHHACLRGCRNVDVVQSDAGAGDDLQLLGGSEGLRVDLRRRAHEDRVDVSDGREQLGAVGAVAVADLEVRTERLDGSGAQLFGNEYDGLAHGRLPRSTVVGGRSDTNARRRGSTLRPTPWEALINGAV